jgi:hypothetical protein
MRNSRKRSGVRNFHLSAFLAASHSTDKPELNAEEKASLAKPQKVAKEIFKSRLLNTKHMAFLCELGVFARKFLAVLRGF